ncbi:MAG: elongation factor P hydroxylase [Pseudomonadota bacterium]|nr:elongation factor P hydroxylase [Pseudomonadota bacterium]
MSILRPSGIYFVNADQMGRDTAPNLALNMSTDTVNAPVCSNLPLSLQPQLSCPYLDPWPEHADETVQVDWLIGLFTHCFSAQRVRLARSPDEPEYLPASECQPAQILFAHGFFASALHEISHWCIAGTERRKLPDLGYWYAPDGRTREQQSLFEQVEVKPQALEWLFTAACNRKFRVSLDNLNGDAGHGEQFKDHVSIRAQALLTGSAPIPADAKILLAQLMAAIRPHRPLELNEFARHQL